MVKNLPAVQETWETWVRSLSREDPLEEEMATHSSILARKIPWTEKPGGLQSDMTDHAAHRSVNQVHKYLLLDQMFIRPQVQTGGD